jgi:hypothetical protein
MGQNLRNPLSKSKPVKIWKEELLKEDLYKVLKKPKPQLRKRPTVSQPPK